MKKLLLLGALVLGTANLYARYANNDIFFVSPQLGTSLNGTVRIQIQPPVSATDVRVWIKEERGQDRVLWRGTLTAQNNYTTTANVSGLTPGQYSVEAVYYLQNRKFDGDVEVWVD